MLFFKLTSILAAASSVIALENFGNEICATDPSSEDVAAGNHVISRADAARPRVSIKVYFHVVKENNSTTGHVPYSQIAEQIHVLNKAFGSSDIKWVLTDTTRTTNADWFNTTIDSQFHKDMKRTLRRGGARDLNIYAVGAIRGYLGQSTLPEAFSRDPQNDGVVVAISALPGGSRADYNLGHVVVHEVGHWVGLDHTDKGGCSEPGDSVSDTPAQLPVTGCPTINPDTCPGAGVDPIHNFMASTNDACKNHFTPGQTDRLRAQLATYRGLPQ